jgi:hypothetical protein
MEKYSMKIYSGLFLSCLLIFVLPLMVACGSTSLAPYGQPMASVKIINGELVFFFNRSDVGVEPLGLVEKTKAKEIRRVAIEQFFQKYPKIAPPNCTNGIELLDFGDTEGGGALAKFKCK